MQETRADAASGIARNDYLRAYRTILLARLSEDKYASLYRAGKIFGGVFIGRGQEELSVSIGQSLRRGTDIFAPLIRDQAGRLAFGESLLDGTRTYLGSRLGPMRGRDGNVHRGRPRDGQFAMISHLGAMVSAVSGALFARRMKGEGGCVGAVCIGDGGTSTGAFHEALNQAAVEKLPLVVVVANNQYAYSTPTSRQFACDDLLDRAPGYGVRGHALDATDLGACLRVVGNAVDLAREGGGPQLIVATLLRLCGHGEHDDGGYIDPKLKDTRIALDCLDLAAQFILKNNWADAATLGAWREDALREIDEAVATTQHEPAPDPNTEDWRALSTTGLIDGFTE